MTIDEAFRLIENLDHPEGLKRKFAPKYSLVQVNRDGDVVSVERFKELPTEAEQLAVLRRNRGCIQINGSPGMYASADAPRERISRSMWLFDKMKPEAG